MPEPDRYPNCYEPYLRYAISTGFENFKFFDERNSKLLLLLELNQADQAKAFAQDMEKFGAVYGPEFDEAFGDQFKPPFDQTRYLTMRADKAAVLNPAAFPFWIAFVSRVELSLPVKPVTEPPGFRRRRFVKTRFEGAKPLLIGVLDDGCPFAAAQFLTKLANNTVSTRVRGIWDQNVGKQPVMMSGSRQFGEELDDFEHGVEYRRDLPAKSSHIVGLNEWINLHSTPSHIIDEGDCYADADFKTLAYRQSHGAHVMDLFAGRTPTSSRIGPPSDRRDPPSWKPGTDPASSADMVFVQFSNHCIRDATGVWLKAHVVEGIKYILSYADPAVTRKVVVNLSYGPTTGPHNGTALLEKALVSLVRKFDGTNGKPKLEIVLPVGNAYFSEGHVVFRRPTVTQPDHVEWTWRVPPDNTVQCFAEIWLPTAAAANTKVTLTPPSGFPVYEPTPPPYPPLPPGSQLPPAGVDVPKIRGSDTMWRLHVEHTIAVHDGRIKTAEHGDWKITVTEIGEKAELHSYVARTDPNMNVRSGARRSYFVDSQWERDHSAKADYEYSAGEFNKTGSLIYRFGTINGIATGRDGNVHVAGGYIIANRRKSPYSSAGPARSGPISPPRVGPDVALPCDESYALGGILGGGNRSSTVFRLRGTSAGAPQLARYVIRPALPTVHDQPTSPAEENKRGNGNVDAP